MNTSSVSRSRSGPGTFLVLGLGVCLLALGWWLRTAHLDSMSRLLHHDEAWYALNAVDLIEHPRFVTFFPENYGRESSWMYVLAGWMLTIGRGIGELRLLAALVGVLTLAATYRLARELFGVWAGLGALAALTVLFWHVMISSHVVRLNFALLLVALAGLAWARAVRRGGTWRWVRAGAAAGLLAYSYFAAWGLLAFLLGGGLVLAVARPSLRRGVALAWLAAALVVTPQAYYALTHAGLFTTRSATVARFDIGTRPHWFDGRGAVSAVRFDGQGGAQGAVRLTHTPTVDADLAATTPRFGGFRQPSSWGRSLAGLFGGHLSGIRGGLAGALEAHVSARRPREDVALLVGDGDDRVVE